MNARTPSDRVADPISGASTESMAEVVAADDPHMAELDQLARLLDSRFRVLGIRFGWDGLLGLIPGVGDAATLAPAAWLIWRGHRMGARRRTLVRMGMNTAIDTVIGGIPVVGDLFDIGFKSNLRNVDLLRRELSRKAQTRSGPAARRRQDRPAQTGARRR